MEGQPTFQDINTKVMLKTFKEKLMLTITKQYGWKFKSLNKTGYLQ